MKKPYNSFNIQIHGICFPFSHTTFICCLATKFAKKLARVMSNHLILKAAKQNEASKRSNSPATIALWARNSSDPTANVQSANKGSLRRFPKSSESLPSGIRSCVTLDWPEMLTESWTTLTWLNKSTG